MVDLKIGAQPPSIASTNNTDSVSETAVESTVPKEVGPPIQNDQESSARTARSLKQQASEMKGQQNLTGELLRSTLHQAVGGQPNAPAGTQQATRAAAPAPPPQQQVRDLQTSLNRFRAATGQPQINTTGIMDPDTRNAIREFQHRTGLTEDGINGPAFERRLTNVLGMMDDPFVARNLNTLFASRGYLDLPPDAKTDVLRRIRDYASAGPGHLDQISTMTNLITQPGFENLAASSKKLMLDTLARRPDDRDLAHTFDQLLTPEFTNLNERLQNDVLNQIRKYGGDQAKIDNLENLITTTRHFDQLPRETQRMMFNSHIGDPDNADLIDKMSRTASHPNFPGDAVAQQEALQRIKEYPPQPDQVDNLMTVLSDSRFNELPFDIRDQVLNQLPAFDRGQLDPDRLMKVVGSWGFKHLNSRQREAVLSALAERPMNPNVANELQKLVEDVTFISGKGDWRKMLDDAMKAIP